MSVVRCPLSVVRFVRFVRSLPSLPALKRPHYLTLALLSAAALIAATWLVLRDPAAAADAWSATRNAATTALEFLQARPAWYFTAMVVLLGFPVPASLIFITAGVVWPVPWQGLLWSLLAAALSMSWSHQFSARIGRRFTAAMLPRLHLRLPRLNPANAIQCILIARLTPGIPFFLQNHVLGLLDIRFRLFLPLSFACAAPYIAAFVITGGALFSGTWSHLAIGLTLIAALIATRFWFAKRQRKATEKL